MTVSAICSLGLDSGATTCSSKRVFHDGLFRPGHGLGVEPYPPVRLDGAHGINELGFRWHGSAKS
jgi:hypothetical protein